MKNKYWSLISDILIFTIALALAKVIQFLLMPMYTTYMSTDVYGTAELVNSMSEFLYPVVTLCVYEASFRFAVDVKYDKKVVANFLTRLMGVSMLIGLFVAFFLRYKYMYTWAFYFVLYSYAVKICLAYYTRGCGLTKAFAVNGVINAFFLAAFSYINLVILDLAAYGYLYAIILANVVSIVYLLSASKIYKLIDFSYKLVNVEQMIRYAIPLVPYNILYGITTLAGRYILKFFTNSHEVGVYVAAIKISAIINMLQTAVYSAFQLNSTQNYYDKNKEDYYVEVINIGIIIYSILGAFIVCFYDLIGKITLRNEFSESIQYLPIILFASIINCISSLVGTMYTTYKTTNSMLPVSILGAVINVVVGILLVNRFGIWGICLASCVAYFAQTIYKIGDVKRRFDLNIRITTFFINIVFLLLMVVFISVNGNLICRILIMVFLLLYNLIANRNQIKNAFLIIKRKIVSA